MKARRKINLGKALFCAAFCLCFTPGISPAPLTGYLKIEDIPGESQRAGHEGEIDIYGIDWCIEQEAAQVGSGRARQRATVYPLLASKETDASSPYLALAAMNGKVLPEVVLSLRKDSGEAHLDYLTITMTNVQVVSYKMMSEGSSDVPLEKVGFLFDKVTYKYVVEEDDHSAGDEHEITYDIAAGV